MIKQTPRKWPAGAGGSLWDQQAGGLFYFGQ